MNDEMRCRLLERLRTAISVRPVPPLEPQAPSDVEFAYTLEALGVLWMDGAAEPVLIDLPKITTATVWLTAEQFRFGFMRLLESALRHPETDAAMAVIDLAGEPVRRGATEPSVRFRELSRDEIVLIKDCLQALIASLDREQLSDIDVRVTDRAIRNWKQFAAAAAQG